ncbi:cilia- and flagella-associated protein 100 [Silurus meridionalis]|nr:cilia- and flagella-associated protein 100 [Silurus meridionalis]
MEQDENISVTEPEDDDGAEGTSVIDPTVGDKRSSLNGEPTEDGDHDEKTSGNGTPTEDVDHDERPSGNGTPTEDVDHDERASGNGTPTEDVDHDVDHDERTSGNGTPTEDVDYDERTSGNGTPTEDTDEDEGTEASEMPPEDINPFKITKDLLLYKLEQDEEILQARERQRTLQMQERGAEPKESGRVALSRLQKDIEEETEKEVPDSFFENLGHPPSKRETLFILGPNSGKTVRCCIEEQREISHLKYSVTVGQEKIQSFEKQLQAEDEEIAKAEEQCNDEAFMKYVQEEEKKTMQILQQARNESEKLRTMKEEIKRTSKKIHAVKREKTIQENMENLENLEFYERPMVYFKDHRELRNHLEQMEDNISRYNKQLERLEQTLENHNKAHGEEQQYMKQENEWVNEEMNQLTKLIQDNNAKVKELEKRICDFCDSDDGPDKQDAILNQLHEKIAEVYESCTGKSSLGESSQNMLKKFEECLHVELDKFNQLPEDELNKMKRQYRQESITRSRKQEEQRRFQAQEELWQQRMEMRKQRSMAEVKKPVGKKVMWRSVLKKDTTAASNRKKKTAKSEMEEFEKLIHW